MPMRCVSPRLLLVLVCFLLGLSSLAVADTPPAQDKDTQGPAPAPAVAKDEIVTTEHLLRLPGRNIDYLAETGFMLVGAGKTEARARIFSVAYLAKGQEATSRPVTFAFNGGPGASSVWLHFGAMGPRRVVLSPEGAALPPPARLTDNQESWLDFSDLVFVDPVGTGYSRPAKEDDDKANRAFWGVSQDLESVGEFVRLWLTRHQRWGSPVFLVGESYGGLRAAGLSEHLFRRYGLALAGLVLVSPALDYATVQFRDDLDLPYALVLPAYTAAAHRHGRLAHELQTRPLPELLAEVEAFSQNEYLPALLLGDRLGPAAASSLYKRLAAYTGLPEVYVTRQEGRVTVNEFTKELLAHKGLLVGRMDATLTGFDPDPTRPGSSYDPALDPLYGPFATAANSVLRQNLRLSSDLPYEILNPKVLAGWDFSSGLSGHQGYVETAQDLKRAMMVTPGLRVLIASGWYDLATPPMSVVHAVSHMRLPVPLREHIRLRSYPAGHMLFTHDAARAALTTDVRAFYGEVRSSTEK